MLDFLVCKGLKHACFRVLSHILRWQKEPDYHIMHSLLYCAHGAGGDAMSITQAKRPKAGHAAQPPPRRETTVFAYANTVYGNP